MKIILGRKPMTYIENKQLLKDFAELLQQPFHGCIDSIV